MTTSISAGSSLSRKSGLELGAHIGVRQNIQHAPGAVSFRCRWRMPEAVITSSGEVGIPLALRRAA